MHDENRKIIDKKLVNLVSGSDEYFEVKFLPMIEELFIYTTVDRILATIT